MAHPMSTKPGKTGSKVRPSSSLLLLDPLNRILLVQRSSSVTMPFSSAYVFPGGKLDPSQDVIPKLIAPTLSPADSLQYQLKFCAIRETFEEAGILLLREKRTGDLKLAEDLIESSVLEDARRRICAGELRFLDFLEMNGVEAGVEDLQPFTTWITPKSHPERYHTKMFLAFMPEVHPAFPSTGLDPTVSSKKLSIPSTGEISSVIFLPPHIPLNLNKQGEIILFPPQFYLLTQVANIVTPVMSKAKPLAAVDLIEARNSLVRFSKNGFGKKTIQPYLRMMLQDGRVCLGLDKSGTMRDNLLGTTSDGTDMETPVEPNGDPNYLLLVRWTSGKDEDHLHPTPPVPSQLELVSKKEFLERMKENPKL